MYLKSLELTGFKSFAKKTELKFKTPITAIVGPNGSGKSNVAEAFRFVLGEQSMKSMRGRRTEDLIWGGSRTTPRSSRAGVKLVFDNTKKLLDIDYDEVMLERLIHRDASTAYSINGSHVRLKDIIELLSGAHIGSSGHHIISQGESDRILAVNSRERKMMIEDALGLKIYQYKKQESQRKLVRTEENIQQVLGLRKEIKPHLQFLKKQVKKVEHSRELAQKLKEDYREYFKREEYYITVQKAKVTHDRAPLERKAEELDQKIADATRKLNALESENTRGREIIELEQKLRDARSEKDEYVRKLGRLEGEITAEERNFEREGQGAGGREADAVPMSRIESFIERLKTVIAGAVAEDDFVGVKRAVESLQRIVEEFTAHMRPVKSDAFSSDHDGHTASLKNLKEEKQQLENEVAEYAVRENELDERYRRLKKEADMDKDSSREAERAIFKLTTLRNETAVQISELNGFANRLQLEEEEFKRECAEASVLVGREVLDYNAVAGIKDLEEQRDRQEERKRAIEKIKIRLEDAGGSSGEEIMKEYEEVSSRDEFLEREITDLEHSAKSLRELIHELDKTLYEEFEDGIQKINEHFSGFFALMFGGGTASLSVVKEQKQENTDNTSDLDGHLLETGKEKQDMYEGVIIHVNLPHKKIRGLTMLSGGERALTSIALIFAMSQVNPPPFLVLDETDAALDEANSKRYGDMIENLAKKSQLVLITHNRETMSRAGVLYGVTMSTDGASQLLSVGFDEVPEVVG